MKRRQYINSIYWGLGLIPLLTSFISYFLLPDKIVAHVSSSGIVDRLGNKIEIFIVPVISLFCFIFFYFFFKWTQKKLIITYSEPYAERITKISKLIVSLTFSVFSIIMIIYIIIMTLKL